MKIADGGLQSLLMEGNINLRQLDPARDSATAPKTADPAGTARKVDERALHKAVEQLNSTAQKFNQPLHFDLTEANKTVLVTHTQSGETMEMTPEQIQRLNHNTSGALVDKEV
ncbi:MAG: flagellar protein FlaG [Bacillota bacterium]|jgi:uncharacterized FlaG/YvyC family protein